MQEDADLIMVSPAGYCMQEGSSGQWGMTQMGTRLTGQVYVGLMKDIQ